MNDRYVGSATACVRSHAEDSNRSALFTGRRNSGKFLRTWGAALALALVASPLVVAAQENPLRARVTDRVDVSRMATLAGNMHALAQAKFDQGAAPPDLPMNRMMLLLKRSPEQESALQDLLVQQQATSSATFHKWLTPDQFGQQFGLADADIQAVTSWLSSFGFQSIKVSRGRNVIEFSGTAAQVQTALHTSIHKYVVNGESHWANSSDPQVPAALAPAIAGFASLHDFQKNPASVRSGRTAALTKAQDGKPQITFTDNSHGLAPADFNTIYNIAPTMTGAGVTIGVVARSNIVAQDVADFRSLFKLGGSGPNIILNGPDPGDLGMGEEGEAVLDATWPGAVAPAATVDLVVSEGTNASAGEDLSEMYIIDNNLSDVMTESFSACEAQFGTLLFGASGQAAFYAGLAEQAAAQGITFVVASGDSGPDSCAMSTIVQSSNFGASVNLLASTPFTVAVGGTEFNDVASPSMYWNATNSANHGSAKSYIPENVWNESCTVAQCGSLSSGLWSSGGGQSLVFPKPFWQSGVVGIPAANARFLPDVSVAGAGRDGYVVCVDASCQGNSPKFHIFGGTSASAQAFGGIIALVVQKVGRVGIANYALYKLAAGEPPTAPANATCDASNTTTPPAGTCIFNDVTVGNTNLSIVSEAGFPAATGYDQATGLGSVNVSNLVNQWSTAVVKASTTTLTMNGGSAVTIAHGATVPLSIAVVATSPATGTPTGDVSLVAALGSGSSKGVDAFKLSSGAVNSTTTLLPGGTYTVTAHYEGDGIFTGSDSMPGVSVTVTPEASKTGLGIVTFDGRGNITSSNATNLVYGSAYILSVSVSNAAGAGCNPSALGGPPCPTGTVLLTDGTNALDSGTFMLNSFGMFEDQPIQLPAGIHHISAAYGGDSSFNSSTSVTDNVTVTQALTTTVVSANPATALAGQSITLTATVNTQSDAIANASQEPTGTVKFFANGSALGSPVPVGGVLTANTTFAQSIATMSTTALAGGQNNITAQYFGDNNYLGSLTATPATVTVAGPGINVSTGCSATISIATPGQSGSCLITAMGANAFSGSVALVVGVTTAPPSAVDKPTCSFGPPSLNFTSPGTLTLTPGSETGNATLTCASQAASRILLRPSSRPSGRAWPLAGAAISLLCMVFLLIVPRQRRWSFAPLALLLFVIAAAAVACGGGSSSGGGGGVTNPGTTRGAYTFTVTATPSGGAAVPTTITVNVQ